VIGLALLGGMAALVVLVASGDNANRTATRTATATVLPNGPLAALELAGPLAVAPDGLLYVADAARDRVLVRVPDGRFRVVAGTGKVGFSGDGGPAVRAELSGVSDLAFAPDGTLYIADGGRVRTVSRDGVIRTIAGDGGGRPPLTISNGTPALSAPLLDWFPNQRRQPAVDRAQPERTALHIRRIADLAPHPGRDARHHPPARHLRPSPA
jgi:hypothetical protein